MAAASVFVMVTTVTSNVVFPSLSISFLAETSQTGGDREEGCDCWASCVPSLLSYLSSPSVCQWQAGRQTTCNLLPAMPGMRAMDRRDVQSEAGGEEVEAAVPSFLEKHCLVLILSSCVVPLFMSHSLSHLIPSTIIIKLHEHGRASTNPT